MINDRQKQILLLEEEIWLLRRVYENTRSILWYINIDKLRVVAAVDNLDKNVEEVKKFDEGFREENDYE